jgi:O-antigen biosynthesis protein
MKIAFLLGSADISGGTFVIFEHAQRLQAAGHAVVLLSDEPIAESRFAWHPQAAFLPRSTLKLVEHERFDVVLATWWRTAYDLSKLHSTVFGYFVQSIESRFYPEADVNLRNAVDRTYEIPCRFVTEATWIRQHLLAHYGVEASLVRNGIRKDLFSPVGPAVESQPRGKLRMLVEGPLNVSFKNVEKTLALCQTAGVGETWLLTSSSAKVVEGADRVFSRLPITETPSVYRSCDILVKLSYVEGMFGPPLEMFHCGGTAIVYDVTGVDEYIRHQVNALVAAIGDEKCVVESLQTLQEKPDLLAKLKLGAASTADAWPDWNVQSAMFEDVLNSWLSMARRSGFPDQAKRSVAEAIEIAIADSGGFLGQLPQTPEMQVRDRLRRFAREAASPRDVVVFGTGSCAQHVRTYLNGRVFRLIGYFDNNAARVGGRIDGLPVHAPHLMPGVMIIIASAWAAEMRCQLIQLGYDRTNIVSVLPD